MVETLDLKIRQMHAALDDLRSDDLSSVQPRLGQVGALSYGYVDFNDGVDDASLANQASLLIANIACIKDHLKQWCKRTQCPFEGDTLIDSNRAVALIHDLWNLDKHAELNRPPRSGHRPRLKELRRALSVSGGSEAGSSAFFSMNIRTGTVTTKTEGSGSVQLALTADIVDEHGNTLGDFGEICEQAVEAWRRTLLKAGVTLP